jgi:hypothetical protein
MGDTVDPSQRELDPQDHILPISQPPRLRKLKEMIFSYATPYVHLYCTIST